MAFLAFCQHHDALFSLRLLILTFELSKMVNLPKIIRLSCCEGTLLFFEQLLDVAKHVFFFFIEGLLDFLKQFFGFLNLSLSLGPDHVHLLVNAAVLVQEGDAGLPTLVILCRELFPLGLRGLVYLNHLVSLPVPLCLVLVRKNAVDAEELSVEEAESLDRFSMLRTKLLNIGRFLRLATVDRVVGHLGD